MSWLSRVHSFPEEGVVDPFAFLDELGVLYDSSFKAVLLIGGVVVDDNQFDLSCLEEVEVLLGVLPILCDDYLGVGVIDDVFAGLDVIGGVDADGDAAGEDTSVEGEGPLRCVEADDVYCGELVALVG